MIAWILPLLIAQVVAKLLEAQKKPKAAPSAMFRTPVYPLLLQYAEACHKRLTFLPHRTVEAEQNLDA